LSKRSFLHAAPRVTFHLRKFAARSKPVYFRDPDGHLWEIAWNPELGQ